MEVLSDANFLKKCTYSITNSLDSVSKLYPRILKALFDEDRKKLREIHEEVQQLNKTSKKLKDNIHKTIGKLREDSVETGHYYVQVLDYLREISHSVNFISEPVVEHVDNNHKGLLNVQKTELNTVSQELAKLILLIVEIIQQESFKRRDEALKQ